jgi:hypothetical protein
VTINSGLTMRQTMEQTPVTPDPAAVIAQHLTFATGSIRLRMIRRGLEMEIKVPGMRLTAKAPKCSTILRREFGLSGKPEKLLVQYTALLTAAGVL